eukprot:CAMPEP_0197024104 /NCGR_PEP_ID=MMETSP1384-20130603/4744_1 /TAXON_ID=29189 /ORGANISM="Ammonia sp." /LENGTH=244 /DNA_ID=CAMNT_0042452443 /DNA_START=242 /DNA_END=973 /DNA_ORIENTATION=-
MTIYQQDTRRPAHIEPNPDKRSDGDSMAASNSTRSEPTSHHDMKRIVDSNQNQMRSISTEQNQITDGVAFYVYQRTNAPQSTTDNDEKDCACSHCSARCRRTHNESAVDEEDANFRSNGDHQYSLRRDSDDQRRYHVLVNEPRKPGDWGRYRYIAHPVKQSVADEGNEKATADEVKDGGSAPLSVAFGVYGDGLAAEPEGVPALSLEGIEDGADSDDDGDHGEEGNEDGFSLQLGSPLSLQSDW